MRRRNRPLRPEVVLTRFVFTVVLSAAFSWVLSTVGMYLYSWIFDHDPNVVFENLVNSLYFYGGLYLVVTIAVLIAYKSWIGSYRHMADLPWADVWPWIPTVLLGPIGWITVGISGWSMQYTEHDQTIPRDIEQMMMLNGLEEYGGYRLIEDDADKEVDASDLPTYPSSPNISRDTYQSLRLERAQLWRERHVIDVDQELAVVGREMADLAEELKVLRKRRGELQAKRVRLQEMTEDGSDATNDPVMVQEEFDQIMQLPGVLAAQVIGNDVRFIVRGTCRYDGNDYDIGDWAIDFGENSVYFSASALRLGRRSSWPYGHYPSYGGSAFCFGTRQDELNNHLSKGQYLELMAVAVECISGVNPADLYRVPRAFRRVINAPQATADTTAQPVRETA